MDLTANQTLQEKTRTAFKEKFFINNPKQNTQRKINRGMGII